MNNTEKNSDETLKKAFEDFQVTPPQQNWEQIEESLDTDIEEQFRNKLQPLKVTPNAKLWNNIEEELPLHPGARRYFSWMTKVAAILVIGMLLCILSDQQKKAIASSEKNDNQTITHPSLQVSPSDRLIASEEKTEFVFEIEKNSSSRKHPRKYDEQEEEEMKRLLQFILDDDVDIAKKADQLVITESLKPIKNLEDGIALAKMKKANDEFIQFDVRIPLIIVETEQEAAQLIQLYESSHKEVIKVD